MEMYLHSLTYLQIAVLKYASEQLALYLYKWRDSFKFNVRDSFDNLNRCLLSSYSSLHSHISPSWLLFGLKNVLYLDMYV